MQLEPEVLIAIIVGAVGAVLGLVGILVGLTTRISSNRALRHAESVQHAFGHAASADWIKDRELEEQLQHRKAAVKSIQKLKTALEHVVFAETGTVSREKVLQAVSDLGRSLFTAQADLQPKLEPPEQAALQRAKNIALEVSSRVRSALETVSDPAQIDEKDRRAILTMRAELSEVQQVFRDSAADRVVKRLFDRPAPE